MKLSDRNKTIGEILGWEKKKPVAQYSEEPMHVEDILMNEGFNSALASCDREVDKNDLLFVLQKLETFPHPEDKFDYFISTMPTWLKPIGRK